ncbi:bifunctional 2-polyprenyl-6-hydroxyphenol methylase/3-demethylubiquinol 3-O-methyltransferase UbiG [Psychromonas sp. Urea-02u-13]|uniref:bifunctional 2-polyprenyl-6-hydroxyphenol methylase/3-demethylubiquinol 3-O-methyltransferase UbiG n=1 Tax=Psychromonas sp. Urea-02u-13 TaxID=2058326 RepID=UPI000C332A33|nr:bifunctional 2-polyprenyl-6-hydroxyphenol methylase/3-demethylubiquinol 3-O-methyltransferase UbiG [Psychromonas sp. Urea-02u-13]PKG39663.1 bifunctional 3-demethylubiquinol 3-O-methyltransferase/2-polyprenyl-6-hydroxyphenol methylase [Psychromonas sp. Urea-02u-13]
MSATSIENTPFTNNVDPKEIEKFSAMAEQWWDLEGDFKPLHMLNPTRLEYIEQGVEGLFGKAIVDIGCGGGILAESMAIQGATVTGIDMAHASLQIARLHAMETQTKLEYQMITAEEFASQHAEQFDVVTCMEMLEHVPNPASIIKACCDLVKPGGTVYFSTINKTFKAYLMMILGAEHLLKWVPKGTHEYEKFIRPSLLLADIDNTSLKCDDLCGVEFSPFTNSFNITKNVDVNYMLRCVKRS